MSKPTTRPGWAPRGNWWVSTIKCSCGYNAEGHSRWYPFARLKRHITAIWHDLVVHQRIADRSVFGKHYSEEDWTE